MRSGKKPVLNQAARYIFMKWDARGRGGVMHFHRVFNFGNSDNLFQMVPITFNDAILLGHYHYLIPF